MPTETNPHNFNPDQLCAIDQARAFVALVNERGIGGGVAPENSDDAYHNSVSGIYLGPWAQIGPDNPPEPHIGDAWQYLLRFNPAPNGFQPAGFNIGLSRATARNHASEGAAETDWNWGYALDSLSTEVNAQIANANS